MTSATHIAGIRSAQVDGAVGAHDEDSVRIWDTPGGVEDGSGRASHREMLDHVLALFSIRPDHDLNLMTSNQDLTDITSRVLHGMRDVLREEAPDAVLVQGDTTTTFAAALASFYQRVPVGHVEAGLRTGNLLSPWPEEANRVLATRL